MLTLTKSQARRFLLAHQGLWGAEAFQGKAGILDYIQRVGCIQFDPLDIVGHNSELALQARLPEFRPEMLYELLYEERQLLDGFDKVMSIYRTSDWPFFRRYREAARGGGRRGAEAIAQAVPQVRLALQERGPLSSLELGLDDKMSWDWGYPSRVGRAALESMYFWGELVIHHKVHTRKYYDFAHRCLPPELLETDDPNQTEQAYHDWHVLRRIGSVGLMWDRAGEAWLGMHGIKSPQRRAAIQRLLEGGALEQAQVEGFKEAFYYRTQDRPRLERSLEGELHMPRAIIMAPLDNLLWDRRLLEALFDFNYRWEVYVPADQRRYGYYVLPVLYGERFVARFEPANFTPGGALTIKHWWWEAGVSPDAAMRTALRQCFDKFQRYLGASGLQDEPGCDLSQVFS